MDTEMKDITDMMCHVFRLAEVRWRKTPEETADIFKKNDVLGFIRECYGSLHLAGDQHALDDVERMLYKNGVML